MLMDVQAGWHGSTVHVQDFPTLRGKQMIVMSLDDVTTMVVMLRVGSYIRKACMSLGAPIWVFGCSTFGNNWFEATYPFLWLLWCP